MEFQANVVFTRNMAKKAYRYEMWQHGKFEPTRPKEIIFTLIAVGFYVFLWMDDDRSWFAYVLIGIVSLYLIVYIAMFPVYFFGLHAALEPFKEKNEMAVLLRFSEDTIRDEEEMGHMEVKWDTFTRLIKFPDMWLLRGKAQAALNLPVAQIDQVCLDFIEQKLRAVGAEIK